MICPLQQAFPEVNKNTVESYTNVYNTKYSLIEDFTPEVYDNEGKIFNSVEGNSAVMNNYSNDTPSSDYYKYISYTGESGDSNVVKKKCTTCPKCKELIYIEKTNDFGGLINDQGDALMLLGLTAFFYYILN